MGDAVVFLYVVVQCFKNLKGATIAMVAVSLVMFLLYVATTVMTQRIRRGVVSGQTGSSSSSFSVSGSSHSGSSYSGSSYSSTGSSRYAGHPQVDPATAAVPGCWGVWGQPMVNAKATPVFRV